MFRDTYLCVETIKKCKSGQWLPSQRGKGKRRCARSKKQLKKRAGGGYISIYTVMSLYFACF